MERTGISSTYPHYSPPPIRPRILVLAFGFMMALSSAWPRPADAQAPRPEGDAPSRAPLARYVPQKELFFYLEFEGLDAHKELWKKTAAYKLINDTKLGALLEDLAGQGLGLVQRSVPPEKQIKPAGVIDLAKHVARHGAAMAAWGNPDAHDQGGPGLVFVARGADRPEVHRILEAATARNLAAAADRNPVNKAGRTYHPLDNQGGYWFEKGDLVLSNKPDLILSVLDGKEPSAVSHSLRAHLFKTSDGFSPVAAGFVDITALPPMPPKAAQLGLDGLKRIDLQWGIQDDAILAVFNVVAPAPRRGILALLDQPTFNIRSLPPLPASLTGFTVMSVDFARTYDQLVGLVKQAEPDGADGFEQLEGAFRQRFGIDLRKDLLAGLGPKFSLYSRPSDPDAVAGNPALAALSPYTGLTISAQVRGDSVPRVFDNLIQAINPIIRAQQAAARRGRPDPNAPTIALRKQDNPRPTYVLDLPPGTLPPPLMAMFQPTVQLGKNQLVIAATTAGADHANDLSAVAPDRLWKPTGAFVPMVRRLPGDLLFLNVSDPRDTLPGMIEGLPMIVRQLNMLLPAVQSARGAARRAQCTNNLKQIGLAMHNYVASNGSLPRPAITDKDGKPLLSWRVAILPYIEQGPLYEKFKLDEPWDSPNNKALIKEMPQVFICPERTNVEPFTTTYRVFTGPGALFEKDRSTTLAQITDGTSNTLLAVEAKESVPWTKPDAELKFDPAAVASPYGVGGPHDGGFNALFADGSVRFIPNSMNANRFRDLVTRNGGEIVDLAQIPPPRVRPASPAEEVLCTSIRNWSPRPMS